jgi:hypothetical protein
MMDEEYEKLHDEFLKELVAYHNAYIKYIKGRKAKANFGPLKQAILKLKKLSHSMSKELTKVRKGKVALNSDKYQVMRNRKKQKDDLDISRTSSGTTT